MDKEIQAILEYYGASIDDSGEPDEVPEAKGLVTIPTPDEEKRELSYWKQKVKSWSEEGSKKS